MYYSIFYDLTENPNLISQRLFHPEENYTNGRIRIYPNDNQLVPACVWTPRMLLIVCEIRHMSTAVLHLNTLLENFGSHSSTNIKMLCFTLFIAALITTIYGQSSQPFIWPLPAQYTVDESSSYNVAYDFNFASNVKSDILDSAFDRYQKIIFHHYPQTPNPSNAINALTITVASSSDYLQNDTDESYNLTISSGSAKLSSNTIYGALRGIETFSQTVIYNFDLGYYQTYSVQISDKPRFSYRGVLLDCSRHFQTVSSLFRLLDAMSYAKFNVFHWHLTDDQSIPYQSVKYPLFWNDAWSNYERYTQGDMQAVVQYAKYRGIRVIPEFDMPGHATSWCIGYPLACPFNSTNGIDPKTNNTCRYPLNPAVNFTFELIEGLISEAYDPANNLFFDNFVHLGGDEVNTYCWTEDPTIVAWMKENNFGTTEANQYFMQTVHNIAAKYNRTTIQWDDVYGMEIAKDTIIEAYYHDDVTQLVDAGYRSIASPEPSWYVHLYYILFSISVFTTFCL